MEWKSSFFSSNLHPLLYPLDLHRISSGSSIEDSSCIFFFILSKGEFLVSFSSPYPDNCLSTYINLAVFFCCVVLTTLMWPDQCCVSEEPTPSFSSPSSKVVLLVICQFWQPSSIHILALQYTYTSKFHFFLIIMSGISILFSICSFDYWNWNVGLYFYIPFCFVLPIYCSLGFFLNASSVNKHINSLLSLVSPKKLTNISFLSSAIDENIAEAQ